MAITEAGASRAIHDSIQLTNPISIKNLSNTEMPELKSPAPQTSPATSAKTVRREGETELPLKSIVKVHVTKVPVKYNAPWRQGDEFKSTGSGFCMAGRLIITNDHVVNEHSQIRVTRPGCATKYTAEVVCAAREVDLAVLHVKDVSFWTNMPLLKFSSDLPKLGAKVTAVGYPTGGEGISITRGVVSRVCLNNYHVGSSQVLTIQIDAAINPGNSGGPVFDSQNRVVGVARSVVRKAQNIGYIIAEEVARMVLRQYIDHGRFRGLPSLSIKYQKLESESFREKLNLKNTTGGVRVSSVSPVGSLHGIVYQDDVLLKINGIPIASDATVPLSHARSDERINYCHRITCCEIGRSCDLTILRKGKKLNVSCVLYPKIHLAPILNDVDCKPRYLIVGGLVFVPLTRPWFEDAYGANTATICKKLSDFPEARGEEVVILSKILSSEVNFGYDDSQNEVLKSFNGKSVSNLSLLAELVKTCTDTYFEFRFDDDSFIVLNRERCISSADSILQRHKISQPQMLENVAPISKL